MSVKSRDSKSQFRSTVFIFLLLQVILLCIAGCVIAFVRVKGKQRDGSLNEKNTEAVVSGGRYSVCRKGGGPKPGFLKDMYPRGSAMEELPQLFFFAGIEGSGHKFFEQVFRRLPVNFSEVVAFEPEVHVTFHENQTNVHPKVASNFSHCYKMPYARPLMDFAARMQSLLQTNGGPYVRSRDSFPLGRVRTPLARPDLVNMIHLDGYLFHLKVVVLLRDLADAVRSAARMGYHGEDVGLQVRIVEDSMNHLDTVVRMLPCSQYIILDFDKITEHPEVAAEAFSRFIGNNVTAYDFVEAVNGARKTRPVHNASIPRFGVSLTLEEFFSLRSDMWPLLHQAKSVPFFFPTEPMDWPSK